MGTLREDGRQENGCRWGEEESRGKRRFMIVVSTARFRVDGEKGK